MKNLPLYSYGMPVLQARYWICTLSVALFAGQPQLAGGIDWMLGQQEVGEGGFRHWQFIAYFRKKISRSVLTRLWPGVHAEPTRSEAAALYVVKEDTRVPDTGFECGRKPINRAVARDWDQIWELATEGKILEIPSDIRIRCYRTIRGIAADYARPVAMERSCHVFWGVTGTGKSRRAWQEAGMEAYPKDPRTKFWCGYQGQKHVVIDEFRGGIDVSHLLRWLDRYPVIVELKGASTCLVAESIWITSNVNPREWYPDADELTRDALVRRLNITRFH